MPVLAVLLLALAVAAAVLWARSEALGRRILYLERRLAQLEDAAARPTSAPLPPTPAPLPPTPEPLRRAPAALTPTPALVAPTAVPSAAATSHTPSAPEHEAWEVVVGTNWLNKIGVLVFVIGVALLVGYSMAHVGPLGRVAIGFFASAGLLGVGIVLERRAPYRNYAYGLIAGGWAGVYFTTFAMHAVPAAQVIDGELPAFAALLTVASGMIAHSLYYRSQVVTALAYLVAYATLALTPLSGFSLAASVPLTLSLLIVSGRFAWQGLTVLGVASAYALFVARAHLVAPIPAVTPLVPMSLTLGTYWLAFEAADLVRLARGARAGEPVNPLFVMNAAGYLGASLIEAPADDPAGLSVLLAASGVAFLASACVRAALTRRVQASTDAPRPFGSAHAGVAISAVLLAWAIDLRLSSPRDLLALLLEAELLVGAGVALEDRHLRAIGALAAIAVSTHILVAGIVHGFTLSPPPWTAEPGALPTMLAIAAWYGNREWLSRHTRTSAPIESVYSWLGLALLARFIWLEVAPSHYGVAGLLVAAALAEMGRLRGREYFQQAFLAGAAGSIAALIFSLATPASPQEIWTALGIPAVLSYWTAWRVGTASATGGVERAGRQRAAAWAATAGNVFTAAAELRLLEPAHVAAAWAVTASVVLAIGLRSRAAFLRWHGLALLTAATLRTASDVLPLQPLGPATLTWTTFVILILYGASLAALKRSAGAERRAAGALLTAATVLVAFLTAAEVRAAGITLAWGLEGAALLGAGFPARERVLRLSGLGLLLVSIAKLFAFDLRTLEPLARIVSFVALGLVLLAISWTYTKFRDEIHRLL